MELDAAVRPADVGEWALLEEVEEPWENLGPQRTEDQACHEIVDRAGKLGVLSLGTMRKLDRDYQTPSVRTQARAVEEYTPIEIAPVPQGPLGDVPPPLLTDVPALPTLNDLTLAFEFSLSEVHNLSGCLRTERMSNLHAGAPPALPSVHRSYRNPR